MAWTAIIAAIIQLLGPILVEWLKKLLERWLQKAAERMGEPASFGGDGYAAVSLLDRAISDCRPWHFGRRSFLRWVRSRVSDPAGNLATEIALKPGDRDELADLVGSVDNE